MNGREHAMSRNVALYPTYALLNGAYFWLPVFFLYFVENLDLKAVIRLEAIYYACVVVLEVPSGYLSDRVGRRPTLIVSAVALVAAYALFTIGGTFAFFAAAQALLAAGIAFRSGTDTTFHYDSLAALGRESDFGAREAIAERNGFIAGAFAAVAGGALGAIDLRLAYAASLVTAVAIVIVVVLFREPFHEDDERAAAPLQQISRCLVRLRRGPLRWLFAFAILMIVLNHVPYEFYQAYLKELIAREQWTWIDAPRAAGAVSAVTMLIAAQVAARSIRLRDVIGTASTLLLATALQGVIITGMALLVHPIFVLLIVARSVPRAIMAAPLRAAIAPRVSRTQRATFFSIQSLAGRAAFSVTLFGLAELAGADGEAGALPWPEITRMLWAAAVIAAIGFLGLFAVRRVVDRDETRRSAFSMAAEPTEADA